MSQAQQKQAEDKAYTKAGGLGHRLGTFGAFERTNWRQAFCAKCEREVFYQLGDPLDSLRGAALSEVCTGRKSVV